MRVLIGALVLCLCAWRTHERAQDWRSDQALWSAARATAPDLARPALNLGIALARVGRWEDATTHLVIAAQLAVDAPNGLKVRARVGRALQWISAVGDPVCDRPAVSPVCAWE